jgi:hypothetical protein
VQSISCCNCSAVPECYGLPIENTSVRVSGLKVVFLHMPVGWRRSVARRQADLLTTQAAADKLQECVHKLTAENVALKVLMVFSDLWRFCDHGVL